MPAKKGFCWCLGSRAPPEISYGVENGGMTVKPVEVDLPMPQDEEELDAIFSELVVGLYSIFYARMLRNWGLKCVLMIVWNHDVSPILFYFYKDLNACVMLPAFKEIVVNFSG